MAFDGQMALATLKLCRYANYLLLSSGSICGSKRTCRPFLLLFWPAYHASAFFYSQLTLMVNSFCWESLKAYDCFKFVHRIGSNILSWTKIVTTFVPELISC